MTSKGVSYAGFVESLCKKEIEGSLNSRQFLEALSLTRQALVNWKRQGLPHDRDENGRLRIPIQGAICWLIDTNRVNYAGRLFDQHI